MIKIIFPVLFIILFSPLCLPQEYNVVDLGINSEGNPLYGRAINDSGYVCGYTGTQTGNQAFIWKNGSYTLVPEFGIFDDINIKGETIGTKFLTGGARGFIYSPDTTIIIGTFGGTTSECFGINDSGWTTGSADVTSIFDYDAFIYKNGVLQNISTKNERTHGFRINNKGNVTGRVSSSLSFFYNGSMVDINLLGGYHSIVSVDINDDDKIVGWMYADDGSPYPFVWNGSTSLLPIMGNAGQAHAINNDDVIVGSNFNTTALIWKDNSVIDLNTLITPAPGLVLTAAFDINNNGQILCECTQNGETRYVILDPFSTDIIVNSTGDENDYDLNDEVCDVDPDSPGNQCTLRAAIQQANHNSGKDKIAFNIPGDGSQKINIESPLPAISGEVEIDGFTQK